MNLNKLFELQKELDQHIIREKGLQGQELLDKKILALQVELGELAQNWRGFKFWSEDQESRIKDYKQIKCKWCNGSGDDGTGVCPDCKSSGDVYKEYNPLLEEYIDCLHFILSIGLELGYKNVDPYAMNTSKDIVTEFNLLFANVSSIWLSSTTVTGIKHHIKEDYRKALSIFLALGELLGFTWEQIEQAYLKKNKVNHKRQENGY